MQPGEITQLLRSASANGTPDWSKLAPYVSGELRRIAKLHLRKSPSGGTMQPTALVNELWVRLLSLNCLRVENRAHFFALSARIMRHILVDAARKRNAGKRMAPGGLIALDEQFVFSEAQSHEIEALDLALHTLAELSERQAKVVELRFFGGMNWEEIATALDCSERTAKRDWTLAKAWLHGQLKAV